MDGHVKTRLINEALQGAAYENHPWLREYFTRQFDSLLSAVRQGQPLRHGFRGLEFRDAMARLGLTATTRPQAAEGDGDG